MKMNVDFWPKNPKANFRNSEMNVSTAITMNYEQIAMNYDNKNKPNTNPIKANTNPIKANTNPKQTQSNPICWILK